MDRFCRIVASSGVVVLAPFLPDYTSLRVAPTAFEDFDATFDAMLACDKLPQGCKPGVFSISFGSLLAFHLAGSHRAHQVGSVIAFGGYADWGETIRFCLTGEIDGRAHGVRDPLNQPVVFMNLIDDIDMAPDDPAPLMTAWTDYVESVWGRQIMKVDDRHAVVARRMAKDVPESCRELFLIGCGATPGGLDVCTAALERAGQRVAFLDPTPYLKGIRCDVHLVHGVDDDVIPYVQSERLAELLPPTVRTRLHLTGLYGHTSQAGSGSPVDALSELWTMSRILGAFVVGGRR
jgi:pimeloyl-ACP methyl ester carboxylesterase